MNSSKDKKEIGGYLGVEVSKGKEYYDTAIRLNSGRNCLRYLIKEYNIKRLWLPKWNCSAVYDVCEEENVKMLYYQVDENNLRPIFDSTINNDEWVYLINYFGFLRNDHIKEYKALYKNLIVDNSQAFFQKPLDDTITLYTCRKFFGVTDGGYLFSDKATNICLSKDSSASRMEYLFGRLESGAGKYYDLYRLNETIISQLPLMEMSSSTQNLLKGIDYDEVKDKRSRNFAALRDRLNGLNFLKPRMIEGAYMYPFYTSKGPLLRKILIDNKVYIPILWPNVLESESMESIEYRLTNNILPLPCDQRYVEDDMNIICDIIIRFLSDSGDEK